MREAWHNLSDVSVSSGRYEDLDPGLGRDPRPGARGKLPSLRSEACLVTRVASHSQSNLLMEHSYTVSHHNLLAKVEYILFSGGLIFGLHFRILMSTEAIPWVVLGIMDHGSDL